jgi:hypothetical protein
LFTPSSVEEAIIAAWRWISELPAPTQLEMIHDGPLRPEVTARVKSVFPLAVVRTVEDELRPFTALWPMTRSLRENNRFGHKLLLMLSKAKRGRFLFSDPDVLVFKRPNEIIQGLSSGASMHMEDPRSWIEVAPDASRVAEDLAGKPVSPTFNAGFILLQEGAWKPSWVQEILSAYVPSRDHYFFEQTAIGALSMLAESTCLPSDEYVISDRDAGVLQPHTPALDQLVVRHYVGTVRHKMYLNAYPYLVERGLVRLR